MERFPDDSHAVEWASETKIVRLPDESKIDKFWCYMFNQIYGGSAYRVMVPAERYYLQVIEEDQNEQVAKKYIEVPSPDTTGSESARIDGRVACIELMPDLASPVQDVHYKPFLVLKSADIMTNPTDTSKYQHLTKHPQQQVLVPIEGVGSNLLLYA